MNSGGYQALYRRSPMRGLIYPIWLLLAEVAAGISALDRTSARNDSEERLDDRKRHRFGGVRCKICRVADA